MKNLNLSKKLFLVMGCLSLILIAFQTTVHAQSPLDLILHYVQGTPLTEQVAYQVEVYLSVLDGDGSPVKNLDKASFTLTEDSRKVEVDTVSSAEEKPLNLVLVMDTSGSMGGSGIQDARQAAASFVSTLGSGDQVSVLSFNESVKTEIEFSANLDAVQNEINGLDTTRNAGTCLYDAAYKAAQVAGTAPSGRRAILLLTDGVDETSSGEVCSSYTADDVIDYASEGNTRVPIYTLGVGSQVDEKVLQRIAGLTGGNYLFTPQTNTLESLFKELSDQFNAQYYLAYTSTSARGEHSLVVEVDHQGGIDQDSRNFLLPALPLTVRIDSPLETEIEADEISVIASLTGQGEKVAYISFLMDGKVIDSDETTPYQLDLDLTQYQEGGHVISVRAVGEEGNELARDERTINVVNSGGLVEDPESSEESEAASPGPETDEEESPETEERESNSSSLIIAVILLVFGAGAVAVFFVLRKKKDQDNELEEIQFTSGTDTDRTMDDIFVPQEEYGLLRVTFSDDASLIGQEFRLTKSPATLGRSADNDVIIPDSPISRVHSRILSLGDVIQIEDEDSRYGTYVNNKNIGSRRVNLADGDEIRLGNRATLSFKAVRKPQPMDDEPTFDELMIPDEIRGMNLSDPESGQTREMELDDQTMEMDEDDQTMEMETDTDDRTIEMNMDDSLDQAREMDPEDQNMEMDDDTREMDL